MIFTVKKLTASEKKHCFKTISAKAAFAIIGDAIKSHKGMSVVRAGDGEAQILKADKNKPFRGSNNRHKGRTKRLGIKGADTGLLQKNVLEAGNTCTYFAPSVSGLSIPRYHVYDFFKPRPHYFDNFFVNEWTGEMIKLLLEESGGAFIIHRDYKKIIKNFKKNYNFDPKYNVKFDGFKKDSWKDNKNAIESAIKSGMQLILFSAGPAGKIIGPKIAKNGKRVVLDIGNTLVFWSHYKPKTIKILIK
ncbi:MAG: hypothetical protein Q8Q48_04440 [Candidatus Staskawiczbacteria bacterium]|nr:hypothetical protein [Candidatus Staskawiczbacteria bacterium]